jgi:hypothetical protein
LNSLLSASANVIVCDEGKIYCWKSGVDVKIFEDKPVGDQDHEVLGMGSFGEYKLYRN